MSRDHRCRRQPQLERLETRLQLSGSPPANTIGISLGSVTRPGAISATSVTLAPKNITPNKHSTMIAVFVQPTATSGLAPRIVAVEGPNGQRLPFQLGRPYRPRDAGQVDDQAVVIVKTNRPGPLTIRVAGQNHTTGSYTVETTLPGDVNGDGQVNLADLTLFAQAYGSQRGEPTYNPAADFNQNGLVNLYDAKALEHNMTPLSPDIPLQATINLLPADQAHYAAPKTSGGRPSRKTSPSRDPRRRGASS